MAKFDLNSEERMELFTYLEALLGCVKSLHGSVGAVMADVAAMRTTLFEDPEEIALYKANLKMAVATAKPMVEEAMRSYDEMLDEIVASQQYQN